jgi:hypothetical protein
MSTGAPLVRTLQTHTAPVAAASDFTSNIAEAPWAGTVTEVSYTADAAVTGANTETRTISVINRGQDGTGTTAIASLALTSGVNLVSGDEKQLTLSSTAADLVVATDDILAFKSTHSGSTGLADPGGLVQVSISRTVTG